MAIDPKKLSAFANPEMDPALGDDPSLEMDDLDMDDDMGEEMEAGQEDDPTDDNFERYDLLFPLIEQYAKEIEQASDELDVEILLNPEMELGEIDMRIVEGAFAAMDPEFQAALYDAVKTEPMTIDDSKQLATLLYEDDTVEDPDPIAGMLFRMAQIATNAEMADVDEDGNLVEPEPAEFDEDDGDPIESMDSPV